MRLNRTPGKLALLSAGLVVAGLLAGAAGALDARNRTDLVDRVTATSGPLAIAAQQLYRALSDADATAASAYLYGGLESEQLRTRYQTDVTAAASALTTLAGGVTQRDAATAVGQLSAQLPVYTGLVETARTLNRQGLPLGAAYLREASNLMRQAMLPAANQIYRSVTGRLSAARDDAATFPWIALPLGVLAIACLIAGQVSLTRRTNRVFNAGLVLATAAGLGAVGWLAVAWSGAAQHLDASRRDGSAMVDLLSEARITALQARGDESLTLVARGGGAANEASFVASMTRLIGKDGTGGLLADARGQATDPTARAAVDDAIADAKRWQAVHIEIRRLDTSGEYPKAVELAVGTGPDTASAVFDRLDADLARGIGHGSERFSLEAARAGGVLGGVSNGIGGLTLLLVLGVVLGFQRRIAEYR
jgi:hypothetical protein